MGPLEDGFASKARSGSDDVSSTIMPFITGSYVESAIAEKGLQSRLASQLHQYCFYPRSLLTPSDAVFVAKFIRTAHDLGTIGFSTVFAYNNVRSQQPHICLYLTGPSSSTIAWPAASSLRPRTRRVIWVRLALSMITLSLLSERLGRCLSGLMADLDAWHQDESRYKREGLGVTDPHGGGESPKQVPGMMFRPKPTSDMVPMSWQQFRNFYAKCHNTLAKVCGSPAC